MAQIQVRDPDGNGIPGIRYRISNGSEPSSSAIYDNITDGAGNSGWPIPFWPVRPYTLYFNDQDVKPEWGQASVPVDHDGDVQVTLERVPVSLPDDAPLHVEGRNFVTANGQPWQFRGYSCHYLPNCAAGGYPCDDFDAVLDQIIEYGYNTIVSVGLHASPWKVDNGWAFNPLTHSNYFQILEQMFNRCEDRKIFVAHGILADVQHYRGDPQHFFRESCAVMRGRKYVLPRKGNEDYSNGWHPGAYHFPDMGGQLLSQGSRGEGTRAKFDPYFPYLDWVEYEVKRKLPKMFLDLPLRQMMDGDFAGPATNRPTVNIEPMFFADTHPDHVGDKRSTDSRVAREMGLMMAACAGGAFGCSLGLECRLLPAGSISDACARAFIEALKAGFVRPLAALDFQGQS